MEYANKQKDDDGFQDNEEQIDDFLSYFEHTWVKALSGNRAGGRKAPQFALKTWNKNRDVLEERMRSGLLRTIHVKASIQDGWV
jgi:hypothetical protein